MQTAPALGHFSGDLLTFSQAVSLGEFFQSLENSVSHHRPTPPQSCPHRRRTPGGDSVISWNGEAGNNSCPGKNLDVPWMSLRPLLSPDLCEKTLGWRGAHRWQVDHTRIRHQPIFNRNFELARWSLQCAGLGRLNQARHLRGGSGLWASSGELGQVCQLVVETFTKKSCRAITINKRQPRLIGD